jgi:hypothetical protein
VPVTSPRASARDFRIAPPAFYGDVGRALEEAIPDPEARRPLRSLFTQLIEWQRLTVEVVNRAMDGKLNARGTVTLDANQATTTLLDRRIGPDSVILLMPTTANAATELATLYQDYPNTTQGQAVLNHANNAQTDRDFAYFLLG